MLRPAIFAFAALALAGPAYADCVGDLQSILTRSHNSGPYVVELVSEVMTMTAEMVPPNDIHATLVTKGAPQELTVIGGKGWMKIDGAWTAISDALAAQMAGDIDQAIRAIDQVGNTQCLGKQSFEGADYATFSYEVPGVTSATIYVDSTTNLPAIMLVAEQAPGKTRDTRATYRYDPSITISPPPL